MTLPAKDSKAPEVNTIMEVLRDKQARLVTIESWLTISGYIRESYNRRQLCELIDEYEQLLHSEQKRLNDHLAKLVHDFNNVAIKPVIVTGKTIGHASEIADFEGYKYAVDPIGIEPGYFPRSIVLEWIEVVLKCLTRLRKAISRRYNAIRGRH